MIQVNVYDLKGENTGKIELPAGIFGQEVNEKLLAQAVRVYLSNQRTAKATTQTRATVDRTKAKVYRQKGTGHARHGSRSAPIYVGGGRAHGPNGEQNYELKMSKKMRQKALLSALSQKAAEGRIIVVDGWEKATGKTNEISKALLKICDFKKFPKKSRNLLVIAKAEEKLKFAVSNLESLEMALVSNLNTYQILNSKKILLVKESICLFNSSLQLSLNSHEPKVF